ncbi:hypothetical protein HN924_02995 [Candidatus Woesearchaeota archaeon]|jgi:hypothetical protein|nr:hypothetical protein [Candidatus Woesearchaeota archaeon]MBT7062909.1 hypothetical protein [Candidatus Woesearchaeota archaeon]
MNGFNWIFTGKGKDAIKEEDLFDIQRFGYKELLLNPSKIMKKNKKLPPNIYLRVNENQEDITVYTGETILNADEVGSFKYSDIHKEKSVYSFNFIIWVNELSEEEVYPVLNINSLQDIVYSLDVFEGRTIGQVKPFIEKFRKYVLMDYRPRDTDYVDEGQNSITTTILVNACDIMNKISPDTPYETFLDRLEENISGIYHN